MNILITGAAGLLGTDILAELKKRDVEHTGIDIDVLDITDENAVHTYFIKNKPRVVIHCAAYTSVDKAEEEPELCHRINAGGTENIARACCETGAEMMYISTDYVFGRDDDTPYEIDDPLAPIDIYGKSKLAGEEAVRRHLSKFYIVRISWVFGKSGRNFVKTMLELAKTRDEISVVNDQFGSPTYSVDVANILCDIALSGKYGVYHATNEGFCSWAEYATEIMRQSGSSCRINPIPSEQYPVKTVRPKNSRMSKTCLDAAGFSRLPTWQEALSKYLRSTI